MLRDAGAKLRHPGLSHGGLEVAFCGRGILRHNPIHGFKACGAAYKQHLVGEIVVVDGERHFRIPGQGLQLRGLGRRCHHNLPSVPMKPDRDDSGRAVSPDVSQASRNLRVQEFLRRRMLQKREVSLFDGHGLLLGADGSAVPGAFASTQVFGHGDSQLFWQTRSSVLRSGPRTIPGILLPIPGGESCPSGVTTILSSPCHWV